MLLSVIILSVLLTISVCALIACYILININLQKIETYENWIVEFKKDVQNTYQQLRDVDNKNIFQKDDDVGFVFSQIINIIEKLKDKIQ
jgi:hypothetical protein